MSNLHPKTVSSFGDEWARFDQRGLSEAEAGKIFQEYFSIFPWEALPAGAEGFDMGCGTGRWARWVAPKVGFLHCIDPSSAIEVAQKSLGAFGNIAFHRASVDEKVLPLGSQDFGYSLGVLHHVPDTAGAIRSCVELLRPGAPFLVYLYYAFDNRPWWFRALWKMTDLARRLICRLPGSIKSILTDIIAALVYWPLARFAFVGERLGFKVHSLPLSYYRRHSFYTMRTDSRDRFGTPLEKRFPKSEIIRMMQSAGLEGIVVSDSAPFWCALGYRAKA
ncbi:MAG: class I SAM-dependent methyltransferase [Haliscomenobacter sp.]